MNDFRSELECLINRYSKENGSNTPDFILAQFLCNVLTDYDIALQERERWFGRGNQFKTEIEVK